MCHDNPCNWQTERHATKPSSTGTRFASTELTKQCCLYHKRVCVKSLCGRAPAYLEMVELKRMPRRFNSLDCSCVRADKLPSSRCLRSRLC